MKTFIISACNDCASGGYCNHGRHWTAGVKAESKKILIDKIYKHAMYVLEYNGQLRTEDDFPCYEYKTVVRNGQTRQVADCSGTDYYCEPYPRVLGDLLECVLDPPDDPVLKSEETDSFNRQVQIGDQTRWVNPTMVRELVDRCVRFEQVEEISMYD